MQYIMYQYLTAVRILKYSLVLHYDMTQNNILDQTAADQSSQLHKLLYISVAWIIFSTLVS